MKEATYSIIFKVIKTNYYGDEVENAEDIISRVDVDENTYLYKYLESWTEYNISGEPIRKTNEHLQFVPKIRSNSSSETKADSSGSLETTSSSDEIPKIRRRNKRNRK
tara:strand:+ start:480 stop:803 length:324 start_codon:yes stop_codon:yes gene_type:complete